MGTAGLLWFSILRLSKFVSLPPIAHGPDTYGRCGFFKSEKVEFTKT